MRIAALYDIHGNLPALQAVLKDLQKQSPDRIIVGGDVVPGPFPAQTLDLLLSQKTPVEFLHGNGELAVLAQLDPKPDYWGTVTGEKAPETVQQALRWTAGRLTQTHRTAIQTWQKTIETSHPNHGRILFCHSTPRSETEVFTKLTKEEPLQPIFPGQGLYVCGHTHMQFDRKIGQARVVNAGSVGNPFGQPGAFWLLIDQAITLKRTDYDRQQAAIEIGKTAYPLKEAFAQSLLQPEPEQKMLEIFTDLCFK